MLMIFIILITINMHTTNETTIYLFRKYVSKHDVGSFDFLWFDVVLVLFFTLRIIRQEAAN